MWPQPHGCSLFGLHFLLYKWRLFLWQDVNNRCHATSFCVCLTVSIPNSPPIEMGNFHQTAQIRGFAISTNEHFPVMSLWELTLVVSSLVRLRKMGIYGLIKISTLVVCSKSHCSPSKPLIRTWQKNVRLLPGTSSVRVILIFPGSQTRLSALPRMLCATLLPTA